MIAAVEGGVDPKRWKTAHTGMVMPGPCVLVCRIELSYVAAFVRNASLEGRLAETERAGFQGAIAADTVAGSSSVTIDAVSSTADQCSSCSWEELVEIAKTVT